MRERVTVAAMAMATAVTTTAWADAKSPKPDDILEDLANADSAAAHRDRPTALYPSIAFAILPGRAVATPDPAQPGDAVERVDIAELFTHGYDKVARRDNPRTVAVAADGTAAWAAVDISAYNFSGPLSADGPPVLVEHVAALYDHRGAAWVPIAWHWGVAQSAADAEKAQAGKPPGIARDVAGAEDVAKIFESTIGDAKALAATVSDRADVVLYGSAPDERVVGGVQVRAKLAAWHLAFKVHDGVRAGLTASKTVAWVGANVDASAGTAKPATPYRALFVYEKTGGAWKLVLASFSRPAKLELSSP